jgi:hypothetical protein
MLARSNPARPAPAAARAEREDRGGFRDRVVEPIE